MDLIWGAMSPCSLGWLRITVDVRSREEWGRWL